MIRFEEGNFIKDERKMDAALIPIEYKERMIRHIVYIEGVFYYAKRVSCEKMVNELIGSYLAKEIGLATVDYKVGFLEGKVYALSKILFEEDKKYMNCSNFFKIYRKEGINFERWLYCPFYDDFWLEKIKGESFFREILKLIAVDLKMGQKDRHQGNFYLYTKEGVNFSLAGVFDYGNSYDRGSFFIYANPFVVLSNNRISLGEFAKKYFDIKEYGYRLESVDLKTILKMIEEEQEIIIDCELKDYYSFKDSEYNKVLRKIRK